MNFDDKYLIDLGKKVIQKAEIIYSYETFHKNQIVNILEELYTANQTSQEILREMRLGSIDDIGFSSKRLFSGQPQVKDYWLQYIIHLPYSIRWDEQKLFGIIQNPFIWNDFNENDFTDDKKFNVAYSRDARSRLTLRIPCDLHKLNIDFAIRVIEACTPSRVERIELFYYKRPAYYFGDSNMCREVQIGLDDGRYKSYPSITRQKYESIKFRNDKSWFEEITEFKDDIHQTDNFPFPDDFYREAMEEGVSESEIVRRYYSPFPNLNLTRPLIFFDTETTGVDKVKDRIIELSIIKYLPDGQTQINTQRFNPTIPIPASATEVHHITDDDVRDKPTFASKYSELLECFSNCDVAGYNIIGFDVPLIVEEFMRAQIALGIPVNQVVLPFNADTKFLDALKIFYNHEKRDLSAAYEYYCDKELFSAHSAEVDAKSTVEVLNKQIAKYQYDSPIFHGIYSPNLIETLHKICNDGSEILDYEGKFKRNENGEIVFNFGKYKGIKVNINLREHRDYLLWMLNQDFANYTKLIIQKILAGDLE